jgi:hypothetical protein
MSLTKEQIQKTFDDEAAAIAKELGIQLPKDIYRYAPYTCYDKKCQKRMIAYTWPGKVMYTTQTPPEGKPDSIKLVTAKTSGETYWANTCPHCGAIQGDWFLESEPDSPFFCLNQDNGDFEKDMDIIADYCVTQLGEGLPATS